MTLHPHPEWRRIVAALSVLEYGTVVTHEEMMALSGLSYPSSKYFGQVGRARVQLLKDWERELASEPKVGYRLVLPSEFHGRSRRELGFAGRRLRRSAQILVAAPQARLTDGENARNANALAKVGALEARQRQVVKETRPALAVPPRADTPKLLTPH